MNNLVQIDFGTDDDALLDEIVTQCGIEPKIRVVKARQKNSGLSGAEIAAFIAVSIASGILGSIGYDAFKAAMQKILEAATKLVRTRGTGIRVVVNGVAYTLKTEDDATRLLNDIMEELQRAREGDAAE